jgi:hypothetical protein
MPALNKPARWMDGMSNQNRPSIEYVRQCLRYEDGKLYWLHRPIEHFKTRSDWLTWNTRYSSKEAGYLSRNKNGDKRWILRLNNRNIQRSHIVWLLTYSEWRLGIDHRNRNSTDDCPENLRIATQTQNLANRTISTNSRSGYKGVTKHERYEKWIARIGYNGKTRYIGIFNDPVSASEAYMKAARELFGEFATDGK